MSFLYGDVSLGVLLCVYQFIYLDVYIISFPVLIAGCYGADK